MASVLHIAIRVEFQEKETGSLDAWFEDHFLVREDSPLDFVHSENSQQIPKFSLPESFLASHTMVITSGCKALQDDQTIEYEGMDFNRYICPLGQGAEADVCIMPVRLNETDVDDDPESVRRFTVGSAGDDLEGLSGTFSIVIVASETELVNDEGSPIRKVFMELDVEQFTSGGDQTNAPSSFFLQTHVLDLVSRAGCAMFY